MIFPMLQKDEIVARLKQAGCPTEEIPKVLGEVGLIISGRAFAQYLDTLPPEKRAEVLAFEPKDMQEYFERQKDLPSFSQEKFDAIHDETWQEYFGSVESA